MKEVEIRVGSDLPQEQLIALYNAVGWGAYTDEQNRDKLQAAVCNSS
jgi:hypothetical protein